MKVMKKDAVFEEQTSTICKSSLAKGNLEDARKAWPSVWDANLRMEKSGMAFTL